MKKEQSDCAAGLIVPTLCPFDELGKIMFQSVTDQARRLSWIDGVVGIAVNTTPRERMVLTIAERVEVIRRTRAGLNPDQIVLSYVGDLTWEIINEVLACKEAGSEAILAAPPRRMPDAERTRANEFCEALAVFIDDLALPVIMMRQSPDSDLRLTVQNIADIAQATNNFIGIDMGSSESVVQYDHVYHALSTVDRPLSGLSSSEAALFHNLNTGAHGVLTCLAYVAPHEMAALYLASRRDRVLDGQALQRRLSPLIAVLSGHDLNVQEMIYREAAHYRGLLASTDARGIDTGLSAHLKHRLHQVIEEIGLKPISWV